MYDNSKRTRKNTVNYVYNKNITHYFLEKRPRIFSRNALRDKYAYQAIANMFVGSLVIFTIFILY